MSLEAVLALAGRLDDAPGHEIAGKRPVRRLAGVLLVAAVALTACAAPTPVRVPSVPTVPEDETAKYTRHVREQIKAFWSYPCVQVTESSCEYKSADLDVEIGLLQSGELHSVEIVRSSGIALYDSYAMNAIRLAAPYPPVPATMMARSKGEPEALPATGLRLAPPKPVVRIAARFRYVVGGRKID